MPICVFCGSGLEWVDDCTTTFDWKDFADRFADCQAGHETIVRDHFDDPEVAVHRIPITGNVRRMKDFVLSAG